MAEENVSKEKKERAPKKVHLKKGSAEKEKREALPKKEHHPAIKDIKLFGKWDSNVELRDPGLANYINLSPRYLPRSAGVHRERFHKSNVHIVERLAHDLMVPGHSGKRHRITSGPFGGALNTALKNIEKAFDIIEKKESKNPLQVFVTAIENAAVREEIISFQVGSIIAREAVITAPQRRVDKTLRLMAHGAYKKSFQSKRSLPEALAEEIILASHNDNKSFSVQERERMEREAAGAR